MTVRQLSEWVVFRGIGDAPIVDAGADFAPAQYLVHEWREYAVQWKDGAPDHGQIEVVGLPARRFPLDGGVLFSFENQLGLARIEVHAGGTSIPLTVEVLSYKYPSPEAYRAFYDSLVRQLSERAATLPFAAEAPTALRVRESTRPRSDLFAWHFLRQEASDILGALRIVLREPRRLLVSEDRDIDIDRASAMDPSGLTEVVARPADLQPVSPDRRAYDWRLARALEHRVTPRRFLPARVPLSQADETLDTPEHRFVRAFLEELSNAMERLKRRNELPEDGRKELKMFHGEIREALHSAFLSEVGPMMVFPSASRVLQRALGYRELLDAWRAFHLSADPFESLERALDARDVATLYEWWCFYELVDRIRRTKCLNRLDTSVDAFAGLQYGARAEFCEDWELIFNRPFRRGKGPWHSYSLPLRPDFILARNGAPLVALDAKFRFEEGDWQAAADLSHDFDAPGGADFPRTSPAASRFAKQVDIYKMHTYRDALGLRASVVVYPGRESDASPFYAATHDGPDSCSLASLLDDPPPKGVGAFPMSPES